jgi:hypothetical protein
MPLMKPGGLLPRSQQPAIGLPQPDNPIHTLTPISLKFIFNLLPYFGNKLK